MESDKIGEYVGSSDDHKGMDMASKRRGRRGGGYGRIYAPVFVF